MKNDNEQKPNLDEDILQCKQDLQKALNAANRAPFSPVSQPAQPLQATPPQPIVNTPQPEPVPDDPVMEDPESFDPFKLEVEAGPQDVSPPKTPDSHDKFELPSFETLQKGKSEPKSAFFDSSVAPEEPDDRQQRIEALEKELAETRQDMVTALQQAQEETAQLSAQAQHLKQVIDQKDADQQEQAAKAQQKIDALEQEIAQTRERFSAFMQHAEDNTAALTAKTLQLQQVIDEKEMARKQFEDRACDAQQQVNAIQQELTETSNQLSQFKQQAEENMIELTEHNRQLQDTLSADQNRQKQLQTQSDNAQARITSLEQELAEVVGKLAAFKLQAEENAAALLAQAQQLRQADDEKEAAQKHLEALTLEWTQTVDDLKTAQKDAAQILQRRQSEIEDLQEELVQANIRLEKANTDNLLLTREKLELTDALGDLKQQAEINAEFAIEEDEQLTSEEQMPEPYCDPVEEVISEDDVHIEQKLVPNPIPSYNLAEQIMAQQRNSSAARRRRPESTNRPAHNSSIEHVMQGYISSAANGPAPTNNIPAPKAAERTERFERWQGESLSQYQESLLGSIVQKDIVRFCGASSAFAAKHQAMPN